MAEHEREQAQHWQPDAYAKNASFVSDLAQPVLDLLAARKGEHILDLGCGSGDLMEKIALSGASVVGIDQSRTFVERCQQKGLKVHVCNGEQLDMDGQFDAVFSNAALHWMKETEKVFQAVARSLKTGGRFVCECGGKGNIAKIVAALEQALDVRGVDGKALNPWRFLDASEAKRMLVAAGFKVQDVVLIKRPTILPGSMQDWLETFAGCYLDRAVGPARDEIKDDVAAALKAELYIEEKKHWQADYVRLRFKAFKT